MPGLPGLWSKLTGGIFGVGVGVAAADAMEPIIEPAKQKAWSENAFKVLDIGELASLVAQRLLDESAAAGEAARTGYDGNRLDAVTQGQLTAPGVGELLALLRRDDISGGLFTHGLGKHKLEGQWDAKLAGLRWLYATPQEVAVWIQRSLIPNQGQLPNYQPPGPGVVPAMPESPIDAYKSAAAWGVTRDQLDAMTRAVGLPASPDLAARMAYRGIIDYQDFLRAIAEGNTRVEWGPVLFDGFRQIPTARDYIDARIRNWITDAEMYAGTARHGMSQADTDLLLKDFGRPMTHRQVFQALRRGGTYDGPTDQIAPPFLKSLQESNVRPEWYNLEWAYRETFPSYFVLRPLIQTGAITEQRAVEMFLGMGWPEDVAKAAPAAFKASTGSRTTSHTSKAQTQLWTATHRSYVGELIDDAYATESMTMAGVPADEVQPVLTLWQRERDTIRRQLSPTQVRKAYQDAVPNPATGAPWSHDDAYNRLILLGYNHADATTYLEE